MPDTTQAQSSHDTMRKWAYIGAQACANKNAGALSEEQTGDKSFMQGSFTRGTAGMDTREEKGLTSLGEGALKCKASTGRSCSPKGRSRAVPQSSVGETRPSSLHREQSWIIHPQERHVIWGKARLPIKEMLKEKHVSW